MSPDKSRSYLTQRIVLFTDIVDMLSFKVGLRIDYLMIHSWMSLKERRNP